MLRFLLASILAASTVSAADPFTSLKLLPPIRYGNLTVFPVANATGADGSAFLTLDEGLRTGQVRVGELGELQGAAMQRPMPRSTTPPFLNRRPVTGGATVNTLAIQNLSDRPLLLLAGEIVSGGKQDRVIGKDRILAPHSEAVPLDVFCVEPGRWSGLNAQFAASKAMAHPNLRLQVVEAKDQSKVWEEVGQANQAVAARVIAANGGRAVFAGAPPSSFAKTIEEGAVQQELEKDGHAVLGRLPAAAAGVVIAVDGRPVWADVFASPALFARYRDKLLKSYVVEAMRARRAAVAAAVAAAEGDAAAFLRDSGGRRTLESEPGLYRLLRSEGAAGVTYRLESDTAGPLHLSRMAR